MSCSGELNSEAEVIRSLIQENHDLRQLVDQCAESRNEALRKLEAMERDLVAAMEAVMEAKRHA